MASELEKILRSKTEAAFTFHDAYGFMTSDSIDCDVLLVLTDSKMKSDIPKFHAVTLSLDELSDFINKAVSVIASLGK